MARMFIERLALLLGTELKLDEDSCSVVSAVSSKSSVRDTNCVHYVDIVNILSNRGKEDFVFIC